MPVGFHSARIRTAVAMLLATLCGCSHQAAPIPAAPIPAAPIPMGPDEKNARGGAEADPRCLRCVTISCGKGRVLGYPRI